MAVLLSLFLGVIPAILYAMFVYWLDRYEKESIFLVIGVFIWGAVVAAGGAFILNTLFGISVFIITGSEATSSLATGSVSAPLVEESLKGMAVLIVFIIFFKEFDNLLDGIVYAAIAALGFAATENSFYIYQYGAAEGTAGDIIFITFIRNVLVGWQHPFYTSFIGIGLATARLNRNMLVKIGAPIVGWGVAVFTHAVHNTLATVIGGLGGLLFGTIVDWTGWLFMFGVVLWAIFRERKFLVQYLLEESEHGIITAAQYRTACSAWAMSMARMNALFSGQYRATNRFYHLCAELAHKKRQRSRLGEERGNTAIIQRTRAELQRLSPRVK